jgi:peroxiredoxin
LETAQTSQQFAGLPQIGDPARDFALQDVDGNLVQLSELNGRPLILNFWATWCPPCLVEMPDLQATYERHQSDGLMILAINREETAVTVREFFYDELDLTFTPLLDETGDVARLYGIVNYPTSIFVDEDGVVTAVHRGLMTEEQIEDYLAK